MSKKRPYPPHNQDQSLVALNVHTNQPKVHTHKAGFTGCGKPTLDMVKIRFYYLDTNRVEKCGNCWYPQ